MISLQIGLLVMLTHNWSKKKKKEEKEKSPHPKTNKTKQNKTQPPHNRKHLFKAIFYEKFISLLWLTFHVSCLWISQNSLSTKLTIPFSMALTANLIQRQNRNFLIICFRCTFTSLQKRQVIIQLLKYIISFSKSIRCDVWPSFMLNLNFQEI